MKNPGLFSVGVIPRAPGVYAVYDMNGAAAYVGISKDLRSRIDQHFNRRDSSVTTAVTATVLNPDKVSRVRWWRHKLFSSRDNLEAGEIVAFEILNPSLRSRGGITDRAKAIASDGKFRKEMESLFAGPAQGEYTPRNLDNLAEVVERLAARLEALEKTRP